MFVSHLNFSYWLFKAVVLCNLFLCHAEAGSVNAQ